ncbi:hypothetical protein [Methylobacterium sp. 1973]|uniref:hypothetical protein n=1 Tax=Methylobacterium sp. 1973 TaxID=3156421 RepID=UPI0033982655
MSSPHANHQGESGDTGPGASLLARARVAYYGVNGRDPGTQELAAALRAAGVADPFASAPAPSDPAGAGGDLGEPSREAIEMMAEHLHEEGDHDRQWVWPEHADDDGYRGNGGYVTITPTDVQCRLREMARRVLIRANQIAHRSGQIVASTPGQKGAGEEKTGATPLGSGSRPSDQAASHPAPAGFDPSRGALGSRVLIQVIDSGYYYCAFNEGVTDRISEAFVYDLEEAEGIVRHDCSTLRIIPVPCVSDEHPAGEDAIAAEGEACQRGGEAETPAQTPPPPPSATPEGDPQELSFGPGCYDFASSVAAKVAALPWAWAETGDAQDDRYSDVQAIVDAELRSLANDRTLHAAGEVR